MGIPEAREEETAAVLEDVYRHRRWRGEERTLQRKTNLRVYGVGNQLSARSANRVREAPGDFLLRLDTFNPSPF